MRFRWWHHLRIKVLTVGIILSILPLAIYGCYGLVATRAAAVDLVQAQNRAAAEVVAEELAQFVTLVKGQLELLARAEGGDLITAPQEKQERILYAILRGVRPLEQVSVVDSAGQELISVARREVGAANGEPRYVGTPLWEQIQKERAYIGSVTFDQMGRPLIVLGVPLPEGQGALVAQTTLRGLVEATVSAKGYGSTRIHVFDSTGRLIGGSDFSLVLAGTQMELPQQADQTYRSVTGEEAFGVRAPVPGLPWEVVGETTVAEAMRPVGQLALKLLISALVLMGIVVGLSILFGLELTLPLEQLEGGARRIGAGDLGYRIPQRGRDELGRLVVAFNAMTARLQAHDAEVRTERDRLDTVVSAIGAGMALIDPDGRIIWVNRRLATWFDTPLEGERCELILAGETCGLEERSREQIAEREVVMGGRTRLIRYHTYRLERAKPGEPAMLAVLEDVTEHRAMERMVMQSEKLAAIGQMAAGVAHEINNPLAVISACAEELSDRLTEEEPTAMVESGDLAEYLEEFQEQVHRCKGITSNLLDFAREGSGEAEEVALAEVVSSMAKLVGARARRMEAQIVVTLPPDLPPVLASRDLLQQVFLNLITNALDAIQEGGGSQVEIGAVQVPGHLLVTVRDDGPGIDPAHLSRVLEPFFTTKPVGQGTGLGLSVCYGIITQLGGELRLESTPGVGTTVSFELPLAGDEPDGTEELTQEGV